MALREGVEWNGMEKEKETEKLSGGRLLCFPSAGGWKGGGGFSMVGDEG